MTGGAQSRVFCEVCLTREAGPVIVPVHTPTVNGSLAHWWGHHKWLGGSGECGRESQEG
jgi:hypothetical protein